MHLTFAQPHLARGLALVSHAISKKHHRSLLNQILLTPSEDGQRLRLSATDEHIGIHAWVHVEHSIDARPLLLPAKLLTDLVHDLPAAPLTLRVPTETAPCEIRCQRVQATIQRGGDDPAEFPPIPSLEQGGEVLLRLDATLLKEVVAQVAFAAATTGEHLLFTAVLLEIEGGQAHVGASDTFRLTMRTIPVPDPSLQARLLIPASALIRLARLLPETASVQMLLPPGHRQILFHSDSVEFCAPLLEGTYPNLRRAIPARPTTRVVMPVEPLVTALRVLLPLARENSHVLRFTVDDWPPQEQRDHLRMVTLETVAPDIGTSRDSLIPHSVSGPGQTILLNIQFLLEALAAISSPEVMVELTDPLKPALIRPQGPAAYQAVLMPLSGSQAQFATPVPTTHPSPATPILAQAS
jgi:DNA polymerase-3 subunit beta